MTLEGLSSVCAKLEPASSKTNEILEINVLQKYTSHALSVNILLLVLLSNSCFTHFYKKLRSGISTEVS